MELSVGEHQRSATRQDCNPQTRLLSMRKFNSYSAMVEEWTLLLSFSFSPTWLEGVIIAIQQDHDVYLLQWRYLLSLMQWRQHSDNVASPVLIHVAVWSRCELKSINPSTTRRTDVIYGIANHKQLTRSRPSIISQRNPDAI